MTKNYRLNEKVHWVTNGLKIGTATIPTCELVYEEFELGQPQTLIDINWPTNVYHLNRCLGTKYILNQTSRRTFIKILK